MSSGVQVSRFGIKALYNDIGLSLPIRVWTDSTAKGLGKLRHLECHSLWVQQRLRRKDFRLVKVDGEVNPADLFTKHSESKNKLDQVVALFSCRFAIEGIEAIETIEINKTIETIDADVHSRTIFRCIHFL